MSERYYVVIRRTKSPETALKLTRSLCRAGVEHIVLEDGHVAVRGSEIQKIRFNLEVVNETGKKPKECICYRQIHNVIMFRGFGSGFIEVPKTGEPRYQLKNEEYLSQI